VAWGAGGALALPALLFWLSERASDGLTPEQRASENAGAETATLGNASEEPSAGATPPPAVAQAVATTRARAANAAPDEAGLMAELRSIENENPARALELSRAGNERFPDSADAPERASISIHALVVLGQSSEARGEAEHMVNHYPDSNWVREIEQLTGAHRHRNVRLNDAGQLETY
jgi:hypothetical protein